MTPEKTTARLSLRHWREDACHHPGVPGQKKIKGATEKQKRDPKKMIRQ